MIAMKLAPCCRHPLIAMRASLIAAALLSVSSAFPAAGQVGESDLSNQGILRLELSPQARSAGDSLQIQLFDDAMKNQRTLMEVARDLKVVDPSASSDALRWAEIMRSVSRNAGGTSIDWSEIAVSPESPGRGGSVDRQFVSTGYASYYSYDRASSNVLEYIESLEMIGEVSWLAPDYSIYQVRPGQPRPGSLKDIDKIVRPGSGAPGGYAASDVAPPRGLWVRGLSCRIPAYDVSPMVNEDGSSDFCTDPLGFSDVLLLMRDEGPEGAPATFAADRVGRCSATRIGREWAITALHCLYTQEEWGRASESAVDWEAAPGDWGRVSFLRSERLRLFMMAGDAMNWREELYNARNCITSEGEIVAGDCGYVQAEAASAWVHRSRWIEQAAPENDIALIRLSPLNGDWDEGRKSRIVYAPGLTDFGESGAALTFAGYGKSNLVSYQRLSYPLMSFTNTGSLFENSWTWDVTPQSGFGGPCAGDSGGAIYYGLPYGLGTERHQLVGVVSNLRSRVDDQQEGVSPGECLESKSFGVGLNKYVNAICQISEGAIAGCPDAEYEPEDLMAQTTESPVATTDDGVN